jgi:hypothetical protein
MTAKLTVLEPRGFPPQIKARGLAPHLDTLSAKTLFLVDVGWENCDVFMQQLQRWLADHEPDVKTEVVRWRDQHEPDPELSERIKHDGDAAIVGVGL